MATATLEKNGQATDTAAGLHLIKLEVSNLLRIDGSFVVAADGKSVIISGPNGAGKTSIAEAIWICIKGAKSKDTPEPIHHGADRAIVRMDLGEYFLERTITEKSSRLKITAGDGSTITRPQELIESFLSDYSLDPVAFLDQRPQDQVDAVLGLAGVRPPVDRVEQITGDRHEPRPGESADQYLMRLSADESGLYYQRRRDANRLTEQKRGALQEQEQIVRRLDDAARESGPSTAELLAKLDELRRVEDARRIARDNVDESAREVQSAERQLLDLASQITSKEAAREQLRLQIKSLEAKHKEISLELLAISERIAKAQITTLPELQEQAAADAKELAAIPDPTADIAACRAQLAKSEEATRHAAKRDAAKATLDRLAVECETATEDHKHLDGILEQLREMRAHLLDGADLGVTGLVIGDGELRLNGAPFCQASQAEQIRTACAVAMRQNPKLKLLRVDEGERLDSQSRRLLFDLARQNGWQCFFTCVKDGETLSVEIVE